MTVSRPDRPRCGVDSDADSEGVGWLDGGGVDGEGSGGLWLSAKASPVESARYFSARFAAAAMSRK